MNKIIPSLILALFALGCTETIYEEIVKLDTVYISKPQSLAPTFITEVDTIHTVDTVEVTVVIRDTLILNTHTTDTVYKFITKDSLIIKEVEKVVYHTDTVTVVVNDTIINNVHHYDTIVRNVITHDTVTLTVYDRTVVYLDSFVAVSYLRPVFSVPDDLIPHLEEFNRLAHEYGRQPNGGVMIVQYVDELPGEGWTSNSFQVSENSQIVIQLDQRYPAALQKAGMFRELGRIMLKEKYTTTPDRIMNNLFSPETTITQKHLDELFR